MTEAAVLRQAPDMGAAEFARWQKLIEVRTGIHLPEHRKPFLMLALSSRMREMAVDQYNDYFVSLRDGAPQAAFEWACLVDLLTVHETRFFRHPESFELLRSFVRNQLKAGEDQQKRSIQRSEEHT